MPSRSLATMLRLRKRAVDEARVALARALASEAAAEDLTRAAERCIEAEARRAADLHGGDDLVEAFATWLPGARQRAAQARADQDRLVVAVAHRRAELAASRTGLEVIETLLRQMADRVADDTARELQRAIDETGSRGATYGS